MFSHVLLILLDHMTKSKSCLSSKTLARLLKIILLTFGLSFKVKSPSTPVQEIFNDSAIYPLIYFIGDPAHVC